MLGLGKQYKLIYVSRSLKQFSWTGLFFWNTLELDLILTMYGKYKKMIAHRLLIIIIFGLSSILLNWLQLLGISNAHVLSLATRISDSWVTAWSWGDLVLFIRYFELQSNPLDIIVGVCRLAMMILSNQSISIGGLLDQIYVFNLTPTIIIISPASWFSVSSSTPTKLVMEVIYICVFIYVFYTVRRLLSRPSKKTFFHNTRFCSWSTCTFCRRLFSPFSFTYICLGNSVHYFFLMIDLTVFKMKSF